MTLSVGFDATAAVRQSAGIGRYTRELLAALARRDDDIRFRLFSWARGAEGPGLPALDSRFSHRPLPLSDRVMNVVWHRLRIPLPVQVFTGMVDLYHSPDFTMPPAPHTPTIVTVHDLAFLVTPETAYPTLRAYLERTVPASARRASHIIAVSEATRQDVIRLLGIPPDRVTTIMEGVGHQFRPPVDRPAAQDALRRHGVSRPYLLSVGTLEPRKNYPRLLEAYALLRGQGVTEHLVIAGRRGWLFEPALERLDALGLRPHVSIIEPGDQDLIALYGMARVFVYASLYEGFGIPPLEAMACGTAVACSATSSLPEVTGDAALYFDPCDVDDIAGTIGRLLRDGELRGRLRERGLARAAELTWDRTAGETVRLYRDIANAA